MMDGQSMWTNVNSEQSFSIYSKYHVFILIVLIIKVAYSADLDIKIPGNLSQKDSQYRLDYHPPYGNPPPNKTISAREIGDVIKFRDGLPGTKYEFLLYYSNGTLSEWLTWAASIVTAPDPPSNLTVDVLNGRNVTIYWTPPRQGDYTGYKMRVNSFNDVNLPPTTYNISKDAVYDTVTDLTPGATYSVQLSTILHGKESVAYASRNFTTKPNTPGKFIVWFRNETTLLVLWQPPYPAGIYTHYQVSIDPSDATESVSFVEKEGEPPGPAQAAFKDLVPGRAYNIAVQTVSEDEISLPTTAQYRTVPLRPLNVTFDKSSITSTSFRVFWSPPNGSSEFDKYQISLGNNRRFAPVTKNRNDEEKWDFVDLDPGKTYQVVVKTVSGKVTSWPTSGDVTLKPLPVKDLQASIDEKMLKVSWKPDNGSVQDSFKVEYHEVDVSSSAGISGDSNSTITNETSILLEALLPGRNYTIIVQALSNGVESNETRIFQVTRPSSPIVQDLKSIEKGLNISWKSDVNSRQEKFEITHTRNDTGESATTLTTESHIILDYLYPGAGYEIKVFAISHTLKSEPHDYFQAVLPHPPQQLRITQTPSLSNNNTINLSWLPPSASLVSEYSIKYKTEDSNTWRKLQPSPKSTQAQIHLLEAGEKHTIQVNSVSFGVESLFPLQVNYTVAPNPVVNITPVIDSTNITLEFDRPEGRIEYFVVKWWQVESPENWKVKNLTEEESEVEEFPRDRVLRFLIDDLVPGIEYTFSILTVSYHLMSNESEMTVRTMPLISSELFTITNREEIDSLTVKCTPTPITYSKFDLYRFQISDDARTTKEKSVNDSDIKVMFTHLMPGKLYNITAWTVSADVLSKPLFKQARLFPETVSNISAIDINGTSISLTWEPPRGEFNAFEVQFLHNDKVMSNFTDTNRIVITDLKPHRNYTFTVIVHSGYSGLIHSTKSGAVSASFITAESVPGRVDKFQPINVLPNEVTFEWFLPFSEYNGIIEKFTITYGLEGGDDFLEESFKPNEFTGAIKNLLPGKTYLFRIRAHTKVGSGREFTYKLEMPILAPPKPPLQVVPTEVCRTTHTIQIRFRKKYFSDDNGIVISYTIIVAEDDSKNASGLEMLSWSDVQAYSIWPPYQVIDPYYPFKNSSVEDFTIGTENCDLKTSGYCNGPLKPGSTYRVKVRAFTAPDKFTDTSFSFPIQTDKDNTAIIVGITVPIVLLLTVLGIGLLVRRNRNQLRKMTEPRGNGPTDNLSLPDSVIETSRPIRVDNFAEHYRIMSADSDFRFSEEFEELKHVGRDQPCTAADLPCNRPKNRFTNILPYDHSRFKLQPVDDEEGSDYINANYVPGHNSPREFIVTQGPLHSTRDDFWRMVWESNSRAIVMLTRCIEKGREKCDHYWPIDTHPVYYGDICVTILNETRYPDWSIMEFMLCRGDVKRVIQHFHFTTWPDFGVPNPPQTLARFVRAFRERVRPDQRPIVVHCSAGVGRSGTFITLDRILQQIQVSDYVDIFGIVWIMRKERVWMVQTEQQYICIHQCLLAVLEGQHQDTTGSPREIHDNQGFEGKNVKSDEETQLEDEDDEEENEGKSSVLEGNLDDDENEEEEGEEEEEEER